MMTSGVLIMVMLAVGWGREFPALTCLMSALMMRVISFSCCFTSATLV